MRLLVEFDYDTTFPSLTVHYPSTCLPRHPGHLPDSPPTVSRRAVGSPHDQSRRPTHWHGQSLQERGPPPTGNPFPTRPYSTNTLRVHYRFTLVQLSTYQGMIRYTLNYTNYKRNLLHFFTLFFSPFIGHTLCLFVRVSVPSLEVLSLHSMWFVSHPPHGPQLLYPLTSGGRCR